MSKINYEQDIKIDEQALDLEWLDQPSLMLKYAKHAALMEREMDRAKEELDLVKSELDGSIRKNPEKYGLEKATDKAIDAAIPQQEEFKEANDAYLEAKFEYKVAKAAVDAFDQRKTALENLVKLLGQSYFAGPVTPRQIAIEREVKERNAEELEQRKNEREGRTAAHLNRKRVRS